MRCELRGMMSPLRHPRVTLYTLGTSRGRVLPLCSFGLARASLEADETASPIPETAVAFA